MNEQLILGLTQGITEWLPVSSEGVLTLIQTNFFQNQNLTQIISQALFLHLGTFLAALVYFRKEIISLPKNPKLLKFLALATFISGVLGLGILKIIQGLENQLLLTGKAVTLVTGLLLLLTGFLQLKSKSAGKRKLFWASLKDWRFYPGFPAPVLQLLFSFFLVLPKPSPCA